MTQLYLVKPDLYYFEQYNDMMREWQESGTQVAPWFLDQPYDCMEAFAELIQMLDDCEHGNLDHKYASTTSYFVVDKQNCLIGAASLRHYLTVEGYRTWGHIGYGIRPTARRKGYATCTLHMMLGKAKNRNIDPVLIACHTSNIGSMKVIENCGGKLENIVADPNDPQETINRYWIGNH